MPDGTHPPEVEPNDYRAAVYERYRANSGLTTTSQGDASLMRDVVSRLPNDRTLPVLDVGCGDGSLLDLLKSLGYEDTEGVDVSKDQVAAARARGLAVRRADVFEYLQKEGRTYAAITAVDLIEHFEPARALELLTLIKARLSPGGLLILRTPNAGGPFGARLRYGDITHGTSFTQSSIKQALTSRGFGDVRVYPQEPAPHGIKSAIRLVLWKVLSGLAKAYLIVETGVVRGHVVSQNLIATATRAT